MGNVERLKTGIAGLDSMLYGGVPVTSQVVVAGGPGSGKTLLCFEVLYRNAKAGVKSALIAFEERPEDIIRNAKAAFSEFADIDELMQQKMLTIQSGELSEQIEDSKAKNEEYSFGDIVAYVEKVVVDTGARFIALDSISLLRLVIDEKKLTYRKSIVALMGNLRRIGVTAFLTVELPYVERSDMRFTPEFFIFDGIIAMYQSDVKDRRSLNLEIIKMRGTNHSLIFAPYEVTSRGFKIEAFDDASEML